MGVEKKGNWIDRSPQQQLANADRIIAELYRSLEVAEENRREIINRYGLNDAKKKTQSA